MKATSAARQILLRDFETAALRASDSILIVRRTWPKGLPVGAAVEVGADALKVSALRRDVPIQSLSAADYSAMGVRADGSMHPMFVFGGLWDSHLLDQRTRAGKSRKPQLLARIWQENPDVCVVQLAREANRASSAAEREPATEVAADAAVNCL